MIAPTTTLLRKVGCWLAFALILSFAARAQAAPQARLLRIDPRASIVDGAPLLTTVVDLTQQKRMSEVTRLCAALTGNAQLDCLANELEKPEALYKPLAWPKGSAFFTVAVNNRDQPTTLESHKRWKDSLNDDGVGTAWLILVDAAASMGSRLPEAQRVANQFIASMSKHDIVNVMYFNDTAVVTDSKWLTKKSSATNFVNSLGHTYPAQGSTRPLFNIIKQGAIDGFGELGNVGSKVEIPLHQALVVLSNGVAGGDISSAAQSAIALKRVLTAGRFPEGNDTVPKTPVPIISVWFPRRQNEALYENARQFMENLANPEIGGFYSIIRSGQSQRAARIVKSVRRRFGQMHIIRWRVPCIAPTVGQTFKLIFKSTSTPVKGDQFTNVPVGIDPTTWPLDIDVEATVAHAKKKGGANRLYPGGKVKIFGNFCWSTDNKRARLYMIPKNQPAPTSLKGRSVEDAKKAQQTLVAANLVGKAIDAADQYVEFEVPDETTFLAGSGDSMSARMVVVDMETLRTSAITQDKILTLPAKKKPLPLLWIGLGAFGVTVLLLLLIQIFRGGGSGRRGRRSRATPAPVVARPGPPGPPGPYGGQPGPGGRRR